MMCGGQKGACFSARRDPFPYKVLTIFFRFLPDSDLLVLS